MTINSKLCNAANYKAANRNSIQYIVIHYTGNQGDTAAANASYFARDHVGASAHYFVDETEIWQSVPNKSIAWHCGTRFGYFHPHCRNVNSIGIEICMLDRAGNIRQGSVDHAAELTRYLMQRYAIPTENVLRHYDITHKFCPAPMVTYAELWKNFKNKLGDDEMLTYNQFKEYMSRYESERQALPVHDWGRSAWNAMTAAGITDGTMPQAPLTREQYAVMQQRQGLIGTK